MHVLRDYLWFLTKKRRMFVRITDEIAAIVKKSGVTEGMIWSWRCTSPSAFSSTTGRTVSSLIFRPGSSSWRLPVAAISIIKPAKTTLMLT